MDIMKQDAKIFVAGHRGLVGSAIVRNLQGKGFSNLVLRNRQELDLLDQGAVRGFFEQERIDHVILAAAKVGGIHANRSFQADFLYENLVIAANVIHSAAQHGVTRLLFLGSSCIYPRLAPQPISEDSLMTGPLEATNEGYSIAKIAGLKLCEMYHRQYGKQFFSAMPTNLYGPGDNFHAEHSHVIPGMMRRFHEAKLKGLEEVQIWGTGNPKREFLHVDDLAEGVFALLTSPQGGQTINVGSGEEVTIRELAHLMKDISGFRGGLVFNSGMPDGTPRKVLDSSRLQALGWAPKVSLLEGLATTYAWALENKVL